MFFLGQNHSLGLQRMVIALACTCQCYYYYYNHPLYFNRSMLIKLKFVPITVLILPADANVVKLYVSACCGHQGMRARINASSY